MLEQALELAAKASDPEIYYKVLHCTTLYYAMLILLLLLFLFPLLSLSPLLLITTTVRGEGLRSGARRHQHAGADRPRHLDEGSAGV